MATASNNEFELIGPRGDEKHQFGSDTTLSCHLSPETSAAAMEIRWFKGTDCVCLYKNRQVTEGRGCEGRVSLFTQELQRGNASLQIRDCTESDRGYYLCQVTSGDTTEELTVRVWKIRPSRDQDFLVRQWHSEWTEEERLRMEESVLLTELKEERHPVLKQEEKLKRAELENTAKQTDSIEEELKEDEKQQEEREYIREISLELREMQERRMRERVEMRQREEEEIRGKMRAVVDDLRSSEEAVKKIKEKIEQHEKQKDAYNETLSEERNEKKRRELEREMERENEEIKEAEEELKRMQEERRMMIKKLRLEMEIREKNALKADTHFIKKLPELIT
ncbi:hypothetical protein AOLI_G00265460 [Acnodon oligacanthus]